MDITKYIGETTEYDKKQEVERRKVKSWLKSVSAFANGGAVACCLVLPMTLATYNSTHHKQYYKLPH